MKFHLQHSINRFGPTCRSGRVGGALHGEHLTRRFQDFIQTNESQRCERCSASKLFAFLQKQANAIKPATK
jgi:hypothetical protein